MKTTIVKCCPPAIRIPRQIDFINTRAMRYASLMRLGLGQPKFISNSNTTINKTYTEPIRNKF